MNTALLDRVFGPFADAMNLETAERVGNLRADTELQVRLDELGTKSNARTLTPEEREEYKSYVRAIDFIGILQAKARAVSRRGHSSN